MKVLVHKFVRELRNVRGLLSGPSFVRWLAGLVLAAPAVLRSRSLGPVDNRFGPDFHFKSGSRILEIRGGSLGVVREIFGHQCYIRPEELAQCRAVLDLGANCGVFSLFALHHAPHAQITAIEAIPELAVVAQDNLARNQLGDRARVLNGIVGTGDSAWCRELEAVHGPIRRFPGDALIAEFCSEVDFLKCDIEGAEYELFAGDLAWLRKVTRMAIEYHGDWAQGEALANTIRAAGFAVTQVPHGVLGYLECRRLA